MAFSMYLMKLSSFLNIFTPFWYYFISTWLTNFIQDNNCPWDILVKWSCSECLKSSLKKIFFLFHLSWVHLVVKGGVDLNQEVDMY